MKKAWKRSLNLSRKKVSRSGFSGSGLPRMITQCSSILLTVLSFSVTEAYLIETRETCVDLMSKLFSSPASLSQTMMHIAHKAIKGQLA